MGSCCTKKVKNTFVLQSIPSDVPSVLLIGLDGSGKSSLFYRLKINIYLTTQPTTGYNVDVFSPVKGLKFTLWDVGGQNVLRSLWNHYYGACKAILFMVDSTDSRRFSEARTVLHEILSDPSMPEFAPVLVMANKQDLENAISPDQLANYLDIPQLSRKRVCQVLGTSILDGSGVEDVMKELRNAMKESDELIHSWT